MQQENKKQFTLIILMKIPPLLHWVQVLGCRAARCMYVSASVYSELAAWECLWLHACVQATGVSFSIDEQKLLNQ